MNSSIAQLLQYWKGWIKPHKAAVAYCTGFVMFVWIFTILVVGNDQRSNLQAVEQENEQLARALKAIEERKRNIVLQYFFIGDTDTYIGKMLDCSRANVTKCRIQALDKLKQLIEEEKEKCQKS